MRFQLKKIMIASILLFNIISTNSSVLASNQGIASASQAVQKIAVILDSPGFYDSYFIEDVTNAFGIINQTYNNYDIEVFPLYNYSFEYSPYPNYTVNYYYENTTSNETIQTNLTALSSVLFETGNYDMVFLMGYGLKGVHKDFVNVSQFPDINFIFYDMSGEFPYHPSDYPPPDNRLVVSFDETHLGYIAGTLATAAISSFPQRVAMIGSFEGDRRSTRLIAAFQGAILRKRTDVDIKIAYLDDGFWGLKWRNKENATDLASKLEEEGYGLIFAALQNENTLGVLEGVGSNTYVITVDSNRTLLNKPNLVQSVVKNNTNVILSLFETFNQSEKGFVNGSVTFKLADNVFYPSNFDDSGIVNETMAEIYTDIEVSEIQIPTDIRHALNTPGFQIITAIVCFLFFPILIRKKRKW